MHLWDTLVAQAVLTLNLLRGSRINPNLSAWAQIYGTFDYNRTPLAPPGVKVLAHDKADKRGSWSSHALDGWYIGPALESYRCYRIWLWETRATRICDTVSWFPEKLPMPLASSDDRIAASLADIAEALRNPSVGSPFHALSDNQNAAALPSREAKRYQPIADQ